MSTDLTALFFTVNPCDPLATDAQGRLDFWNNNRALLSTHGLDLYELSLVGSGTNFIDCWPSQYPMAGGTYPFAHCEDISQHAEWGLLEPFSTTTRGGVIFANDRGNRPVALKLVENNSCEHIILKLIMDVQDCDGYIPGIVPVLNLIPIAGHWIVVMPRWECGPSEGWFFSVRELLFCFEQLLCGLVFLHSRRIVHRDLHSRNCLANFFPTSPNNIEYSDAANPLQKLQASHTLRYGWIDFGYSIPLPPQTDLETCRLHRRESFFGAWEVPSDTLTGKSTYNPFAFDVGTLGLYFCSISQHLTPQIPLLAPFLDMMITRKVHSRFTADAALEFLRFIQSSLTKEELMRPCELPPYTEYSAERYDRWQGLPRDFVEEWGHMREPELPLWLRCVRWVLERYDAVADLVVICRRGLDRIRDKSRILLYNNILSSTAF
ncbi:hypothetical protein MKEN_00341200 [Mycena kentingensis (nom. inval.)]|nr:hypothetical protein MKEN_00341200 [Mycena kentingensis (nom. inval.)]